MVISRPRHLSSSYLNFCSNAALPLTGAPSDRLQPVVSTVVLVPQAANPTAIKPKNKTVFITKHLAPKRYAPKRYAAKRYAATDRGVVIYLNRRDYNSKGAWCSQAKDNSCRQSLPIERLAKLIC